MSKKAILEIILESQLFSLVNLHLSQDYCYSVYTWIHSIEERNITTIIHLTFVLQYDNSSLYMLIHNILPKNSDLQILISVDHVWSFHVILSLVSYLVFAWPSSLVDLLLINIISVSEFPAVNSNNGIIHKTSFLSSWL